MLLVGDKFPIVPEATAAAAAAAAPAVTVDPLGGGNPMLRSQSLLNDCLPVASTDLVVAAVVVSVSERSLLELLWNDDVSTCFCR